MSIQCHDLNVIHVFLTSSPALFFGFHFISDTSYEPLWDTPHEVYKQNFLPSQFPYNFLSFSFCHWAWRWEWIFTIHLTGFRVTTETWLWVCLWGWVQKKMQTRRKDSSWIWAVSSMGPALGWKKKVSRAPAFISLWFLTADLTAPLPTVHSTSGPGRLYPSLNCKSKQTPSSLRCFLSGRGNEKGNSLTGTPALICYGLHFKPRRAHGPQKQDST